jgi:hypothetical protein
LVSIAMISPMRTLVASARLVFFWCVGNLANVL